MARCITCGTQLRPERAEKYDYCTGADCQAKNAQSLTIASVGINKAADRYVILDERTQKEMAGGRYQDPRRASSISHARPLPRREGAPGPTRAPGLDLVPSNRWNHGQRPSRTSRSLSTSRGGKRSTRS